MAHANGKMLSVSGEGDPRGEVPEAQGGRTSVFSKERRTRGVSSGHVKRRRENSRDLRSGWECLSCIQEEGKACGCSCERCKLSVTGLEK